MTKMQVQVKSGTPHRTGYDPKVDKFPLLMEYLDTGEMYIFTAEDQAIICSHTDERFNLEIVKPDIYNPEWAHALAGTTVTFTV